MNLEDRLLELDKEWESSYKIGWIMLSLVTTFILLVSFIILEIKEINASTNPAKNLQWNLLKKYSSQTEKQQGIN